MNFERDFIDPLSWNYIDLGLWITAEPTVALGSDHIPFFDGAGCESSILRDLGVPQNMFHTREMFESKLTMAKEARNNPDILLRKDIITTLACSHIPRLVL